MLSFLEISFVWLSWNIIIPLIFLILMAVVIGGVFSTGFLLNTIYLKCKGFLNDYAKK